jgi:transcriptional regulator with XRE-family HTH domain
MDSRVVVGKNVRRLREKLGFSQEQLAFETGLHRTYISGVERGVRNPTVLIIDRLAQALKEEPAALLTRPTSEPTAS